MNDDERNDKLIAAASKLSTEITPERDLWPGIAESIAQPRRPGWMPMFAQAAVVAHVVAQLAAGEDARVHHTVERRGARRQIVRVVVVPAVGDHDLRPLERDPLIDDQSDAEETVKALIELSQRITELREMLTAAKRGDAAAVAVN